MIQGQPANGSYRSLLNGGSSTLFRFSKVETIPIAASIKGNGNRRAKPASAIDAAVLMGAGK